MLYENGKYANVTDEELIDRLRAGETEIAEYLCDKYKDLVDSILLSGVCI